MRRAMRVLGIVGSLSGGDGGGLLLLLFVESSERRVFVLGRGCAVSNDCFRSRTRGNEGAGRGGGGP